MGDESATNSHDSICPICLGPLTQESYLDHCLHKFCFNCILRWTNIVSSKHQTPPSSVKCPLCKVRLFPSLFNSYHYYTLIYYADFVMQTDNFSIIYGLDGTSFQRHYINTNLQDWFVVSLTMPLLISFFFFLYKFQNLVEFSFYIICMCSFVLSKAHRYRLQCYYTQQGLL